MRACSHCRLSYLLETNGKMRRAPARQSKLRLRTAVAPVATGQSNARHGFDHENDGRLCRSRLRMVRRAGRPEERPPPPWAFMVIHEESEPTASSKLITVLGSAQRITEKAINDPFADADWFPEDHPAMPKVVADGYRPHLWACSYCHGATRVGDPASAADAKAAANYFSKLRYHPRVHVVEAAMVPKTRYESFFPVRVTGGSNEPIGMVIREIPDNVTLENDGDWRVSITAYVPPASVARGKALVQSGAGALPCTPCHGARLQGVGIVPPLAGGTPTDIVRQHYDIQYGYRRGDAVAPMQPEVAI